MTQRQYELSDFEWSIIQPLLPNKPRGVPRADDRKALNGIYWRLRTGSPWADIPERYGPTTTCANRFRRWVQDRCVGPRVRGGVGRLRRRPADDPPFGSTSTAAASKKGALRHARHRSGPRSSPVHGALAWRPDDQDPRARRRRRAASRPR